MIPVRVAAVTPSEMSMVRILFEEYWKSFGFSPCFQAFDVELAGLPGGYAPPGGRLALAFDDAEPVGCIALRRIDPRRCEAKRLYVKPAWRRRGAGRALLAWVIAEAKAAGYSELLGDTMPYMDTALAMYERMGFQRAEPYSPSPAPDAIYLRLVLS